MSEANSASPSPSISAPFKLADRQVRFSATEVSTLTRSLKVFLETDKRVEKIPMLNRASSAWLQENDRGEIDANGQVRIGLWNLQPREGSVFLVHRTPNDGAAFGMQYLASLKHIGTSWEIGEITWEKITYRR
jgi:hypothetical protein